MTRHQLLALTLILGLSTAGCGAASQPFGVRQTSGLRDQAVNRDLPPPPKEPAMSEKTVGAPEADTAALQTTIEGKLAAMSAPDAGKIYTLDGVYPQSDGIVIITVKRYKIALSNTGVALDEYGMGGTYDPKTGSVRLEKSD